MLPYNLFFWAGPIAHFGQTHFQILANDLSPITLLAHQLTFWCHRSSPNTISKTRIVNILIVMQGRTHSWCGWLFSWMLMRSCNITKTVKYPIWDNIVLLYKSCSGAENTGQYSEVTFVIGLGLTDNRCYIKYLSFPFCNSCGISAQGIQWLQWWQWEHHQQDPKTLQSRSVCHFLGSNPQLVLGQC